MPHNCSGWIGAAAAAANNGDDDEKNEKQFSSNPCTYSFLFFVFLYSTKQRCVSFQNHVKCSIGAFASFLSLKTDIVTHIK